MFKKLIRKIIYWSGVVHSNEPDAVVSWPASQIMSKSGSSNSTRKLEETENGTNFTVYTAVGGKIIQCWYYEPVKGINKSQLYLIPNDVSFSEEISMIMTKESLSR